MDLPFIPDIRPSPQNMMKEWGDLLQIRAKITQRLIAENRFNQARLAHINKIVDLITNKRSSLEPRGESIHILDLLESVMPFFRKSCVDQIPLRE
jgi:hypothetical protein